MMKLKKSTLIIAFFILFTNMMFSQNSPTQLVEKFFDIYQNKSISAALDDLYSTNPWIERKIDAVTKLKNEMEGLNEDYVGKYYGYELITEKSISDSYVLQSYLVKYDRQPIRYTFQFYKPDNDWKIYSFEYDGSLDEELEESAKIYYRNLGK